MAPPQSDANDAPVDVGVDVDVEASNGSARRFNYQKKDTSPESFLVSKQEQKELTWSNINMKLLEKKNGTEEVKLNILSNVWGKAEAGKTTAIMGASGAGKTSLFQTLAGRVSSHGEVVVEGDMYLGGVKINPRDYTEHRKLFAYVAQDDALHEASTPREALEFSAKLRLPKTTSDAQITKIVNQCLEELGLDGAVADTITGGGLKKGISGGEKRRVSIGVELVASPSIIFMDEPTSGLDSYAAAQVMKLLDRVAKAGNTVLFTIHQPSSNIFSQFDRLILLNKGQVMYQGDVSKLNSDFEAHGQPIPANYNPADWIIDVAQTNTMEDLQKCGFFVQEPLDHLKTILKPDGELVLPEQNKVSVWQEFRMLQQREMRNMHRNPLPMIINVTMTSVLSIIFGVIFLDIGRQDRSDFSVLQAQMGAIVNLLISTLMGQSNTAIFIFSSERPLFLREYSTEHYTIVPYFLSKLWSEAINSFAAVLVQALITYWMMGFQMSFGFFLAITYSLAMTATAVAVMLGAFFTDPNNALSLFTLVVVPQFYFSGLFIAIELIPSWVSWAQYLCSLTYASRLGFAYEFGECAAGAAQENCNAILDANNVAVDDTWWYWLALMGLFVMFRLGGIFVLRSKAKY